MKISVNIPWNRYGLIAELANRLHGQLPQFGKTILQKMIYLLQEVYGKKFGYHFDLYTYGPFTSQLLQDLDAVEALNGVRVSHVLSELGGYHIEPGTRNEDLRERAREYFEEYNVSEAIDRLIRDFGSFTAKYLELLSTIVYVDRDMKASKRPLSRVALVQIVNEIKPKFSRDEIIEALSTLVEKRIVSF